MNDGYRRVRTTEVEAGEAPGVEFFCGSGTRLIVLYPSLGAYAE